MLRKKQVVVVVSIAIVSFLVGTMFNVVTGAGGSPWDMVWSAITELQSEVDIVNASVLQLQEEINNVVEKANQVKTIRFCEPAETINDDPGYETAASFTWIPNNATDNAILSIYCYFEYILEDSSCTFRILINDRFSGGVTGFVYSSTYRWSALYSNRDFWDQKDMIPVNQESYTIEFEFNIAESPAHIRNVNIIIEVLDGLPSNT